MQTQLLKSALGRTRPCDYDSSLVRDLAPKDYSCPSGALPLVIALCAGMGWSRVALGHHHVSDVVIGLLLGAAIAAAVSAFVY